MRTGERVPFRLTYRLPDDLTVGLRLEIQSHEPFEGKHYHLIGTVCIPPTATHSGAVMVQLQVDKGLVEERRGSQVLRRSLAGETVWVPWSARYIHIHIPRPQSGQQGATGPKERVVSRASGPLSGASGRQQHLRRSLTRTPRPG